MIKGIATLVLFLLCSHWGHSQQWSANLTSKDSLEADVFVGLDDLDNLYYVKKNVLYKRSGKRLFSYSKVGLGPLHDVNIQNPFKLILFYPDFNAVILLDNNLNELTGIVDLSRETLFNNVTHVSGSSQNNIWLFADDNKLHLYDYNRLSEEVQTQPMTFYEPDFTARSLKSTYKNVWVLSNTGVHRFNEYGNYLSTLKETGITGIYPFKKGYIYSKEGRFWYHQDSDAVPIDLVIDHPVKQIAVNGSSILIFDGTWVYQYRIQS